MRSISIALSALVALVTVGAAGAALANPPGRSTILHCGCNEAGDGMVYNEITVSSRTRGHDAHVAASIDSCFDGIDTYNDVVRTGSDCQLSGPPLGDPIASCDGPAEDDVCGTLIID